MLLFEPCFVAKPRLENLLTSSWFQCRSVLLLLSFDTQKIDLHAGTAHGGQRNCVIV